MFDHQRVPPFAVKAIFFMRTFPWQRDTASILGVYPLFSRQCHFWLQSSDVDGYPVVECAIHQITTKLQDWKTSKGLVEWRLYGREHLVIRLNVNPEFIFSLVDEESTFFSPNQQLSSSGWWLGTWLLFSHILGVILIDFPIFQGDRYTTNQYSMIEDLWISKSMIEDFFV